MATQEEQIQALKDDLFREVPYEDPRNRVRTTPMQVLNLSFLRTGSMTMQAALTQLGFRCFHSVTSFFPAIQETDLWIEALNRKFRPEGPPLTKEDFDRMLGHFSAVSADAPAICFAEELINFYPDSKVILIERDIEAWHKSYCNTIVKNMHDPWNVLVANYINPGYVGKLYWVHTTWRKLWIGANDADEHRVKSKQVYREHYDLMRRITPKERLLEFKLTDGWEPLCQFLQVPVPETPFPRVNDTEAYAALVNAVVMRGFVSVMKKASLYISAIIVVGVGWVAFR
ncbi:hypothetical protein PRZ48_009337 [Zasmidium cellare]|uniref:Uncharacterized protein n=1 Tax=Zasmidium cellare TaxID=395010 RepID=A0ABR0EBG3_ZASCE|nr:hypothetical protein PRZ48_009337 [Zasmidium cellare]